MEILSPASNMDHIEVAIDGKANAVYGGLKKWNARNKAINFSTEEYNILIKQLHEHNIKFFLTLNILMLDSEIEEVVNFLKNNTLPDAFIVTDIGLIQALHNVFPDVPLHFSTQFGAHNLDDINYIKSLNGKRAILSRELTLEEINKIKNKTDIELECFIWGSQCLSFSGLCFFGTLINGGGGNRGKCIITCRDIYSVNGELGHHLYVPDMNCINLISKLNGIDCLKLEGRRRNPEEIKKILKQIYNKSIPSSEKGYLLGTEIKQNKLYEKINLRVAPSIKASELKDIGDNDICIRYLNNKPLEFSKDYSNPNVMYVYTEIKKPYITTKKNISLDINVKNNIVCEVLYMNYKGDGHTFYGDNHDLLEINLNQFVAELEYKNNHINLYKIKYQRTNNEMLKINKNLYKKIIKYIHNDCKTAKHQIVKQDFKLEFIYLETNDLKVINEFINDKFVKIIYNIESVNRLKNIEQIIDNYGDLIIYKLPIFNWKSENLFSYIKLLEKKEVMFTRFTQLYLTKDLKFKKKYTDYTIYVWNKKTLNYLTNYEIDEYTASPELSYKTNELIFKNQFMQVILGGKLPLVYTRSCFRHLYGCENCYNNQCKKKIIKNEDKKLDFEIYCNDDYRYLLNSNPILNDYSKVKTNSTTTYRYITLGQNIEEIKTAINCFKKIDYYTELKKNKFWKYSYECNLFEGKE